MTNYIAGGPAPTTRALDIAFRALSDREMFVLGRAFGQLARETTSSAANVYAALSVECMVRLKHREEALAWLESDLVTAEVDDEPPLPTVIEGDDLDVVLDENDEPIL